jgi:hypothetical protein
MAENNQRNQEGNMENQRNEQSMTEQNRGSRQEVSNEQSDRLESQPGNMSGVSTENQRSQRGNQDMGARGGSDMESRENL